MFWLLTLSKYSVLLQTPEIPNSKPLEPGSNQNSPHYEGGEGEMYVKSNMETYITICKADSQQELETQTGALYQSIGVGWGGRWEEVQEEGNICIFVTDSC